MTLDEAKQEFIQSWGVLGSSWGINKTMAQIHALLLIATEPQSTEEIMSALHISRGNANMNIRALIDWGIVSKTFKAGERKEFFIAEKDIWETAKQVVIERRKRELEPLLKALKQVNDLDDNTSEEAKEFKKITHQISNVAQKTDAMLTRLVKADQHWFVGSLFKFMK